METIVKIKWNKPAEQQWLCPENIQVALEQHCKNTKFDVELVSDRHFEAYATFCIECDRQAVNPLKYKDFLRLKEDRIKG